MAKILNFFKSVNIAGVFNTLCDTYLLSIVFYNLYMIILASSKFAVGKHSVAIIMALLVAFLISRLRK